MAIKVSGTTVVDDSRNITNVIGVGDTATTIFYGNGSGLSNTGATLSAASGSQRLVVTSGTSGVMTTAATNANLTWNSTSGTLSATNVSIAGTLTYEDVTNVDSIGIITARSGVRITTGGLVVTAGVSTFSASSLFTANPKLNDSVILEIGTSADWELFHDGSNNYSDLNVGNLIIRDGTTTRFTFERTTGNFTATGNVTGYSDETLKDNIKTIPDALDKVTQLRGVEFDRNDIEGNPHQIGVIAQEVEKVIPEVVTTHDDGIKSVAYGNLVGVLIEAIKELKEEVNELKARLEEV